MPSGKLFRGYVIHSRCRIALLQGRHLCEICCQINGWKMSFRISRLSISPILRLRHLEEAE